MPAPPEDVLFTTRRPNKGPLYKSVEKGTEASTAGTSVFYTSFYVFVARIPLLLGLLLLQSVSSFVLDFFHPLLESNVDILLFLTMIVGAGGNSGNQAAVRVITLIAKENDQKLQRTQQRRIILEELLTGLSLGGVIAVVGYVRVIAFLGATNKALLVAATVMISLFIIVFTAVLVGAYLPIALQHINSSPEHAGPAIQVVMDIVGVIVTCLVASVILKAN